MFRLACIMWCLLISISLPACNSNPSVEMSKAVQYKVVQTEDFSFPGRKRVGASIVVANNNLTFEQKAHTAMKAAADLQKQTQAKMVSVLMEYSSETLRLGYVAAKAEYSPDNGGYSGSQGYTWDVEATTESPTELELATLKLWGKNRSRFQKDGSTDEPQLSKFIADQLSIRADEVSLPLYSLKSFLHQ